MLSSKGWIKLVLVVCALNRSPHRHLACRRVNDWPLSYAEPNLICLKCWMWLYCSAAFFFPAMSLIFTWLYLSIHFFCVDDVVNNLVLMLFLCCFLADQILLFISYPGEVQCEQPNNSLYTFTGNLIIQKQTLPLSPNQLLLRVCLKACDHIYCMSVCSIS